jgi:regulator of protease activity HflC (stomatin/prohibitin superfamily)
MDSEGTRQAQINNAEGQKAEVVLNSEAAYIDQVNRAKGEAEAILFVAEATAKSIEVIASSITKNGGAEAVNLKVAEKYVEAFSHIARESSTVILPADLSNPGNFIAQSLSIFDKLNETKKGKRKE